MNNTERQAHEQREQAEEEKQDVIVACIGIAGPGHSSRALSHLGKQWHLCARILNTKQLETDPSSTGFFLMALTQYLRPSYNGYLQAPPSSPTQPKRGSFTTYAPTTMISPYSAWPMTPSVDARPLPSWLSFSASSLATIQGMRCVICGLYRQIRAQIGEIVDYNSTSIRHECFCRTHS